MNNNEVRKHSLTLDDFITNTTEYRNRPRRSFQEIQYFQDEANRKQILAKQQRSSVLKKGASVAAGTVLALTLSSQVIPDTGLQIVNAQSGLYETKSNTGNFQSTKLGQQEILIYNDQLAGQEHILKKVLEDKFSADFETASAIQKISKGNIQDTPTDKVQTTLAAVLGSSDPLVMNLKKHEKSAKESSRDFNNDGRFTTLNGKVLNIEQLKSLPGGTFIILDIKEKTEEPIIYTSVPLSDAKEGRYFSNGDRSLRVEEIVQAYGLPESVVFPKKGKIYIVEKVRDPEKNTVAAHSITDDIMPVFQKVINIPSGVNESTEAVRKDIGKAVVSAGNLVKPISEQIASVNPLNAGREGSKNGERDQRIAVAVTPTTKRNNPVPESTVPVKSADTVSVREEPVKTTVNTPTVNNLPVSRPDSQKIQQVQNPNGNTSNQPKTYTELIVKSQPVLKTDNSSLGNGNGQVAQPEIARVQEPKSIKINTENVTPESTITVPSESPSPTSMLVPNRVVVISPPETLASADRSASAVSESIAGKISGFFESLLGNAPENERNDIAQQALENPSASATRPAEGSLYNKEPVVSVSKPDTANINEPTPISLNTSPQNSTRVAATPETNLFPELSPTATRTPAVSPSIAKSPTNPPSSTPTEKPKPTSTPTPETVSREEKDKEANKWLTEKFLKKVDYKVYAARRGISESEYKTGMTQRYINTSRAAGTNMNTYALALSIMRGEGRESAFDPMKGNSAGTDCKYLGQVCTATAEIYIEIYNKNNGKNFSYEDYEKMDAWDKYDVVLNQYLLDRLSRKQNLTQRSGYDVYFCPASLGEDDKFACYTKDSPKTGRAYNINARATDLSSFGDHDGIIEPEDYWPVVLNTERTYFPDPPDKPW